MYLNKPDYTGALKWFHQACELRHPQRLDCPEDDWLRAECDTGGAKACYSAGLLLESYPSLVPPAGLTATKYLQWATDNGVENASDALKHATPNNTN